MDWWEPTLENYLSHVSKDRVLEVVGEAFPLVIPNLDANKRRMISADSELTGLHWLSNNLKVK
ncbi:MAG TPA: hypothetical protein VIQ51_06885 [Chryseosolibacter sp.]